jgi:hypothetical protein
MTPERSGRPSLAHAEEFALMVEAVRQLAAAI